MMRNGKSVLVATDLSARSDRAIDRATFLANQWGERLIVLHALETGSPFYANADLAEQAIRAALPDPQADVDIVPAIGPAPATIVEAAASADCSLIVTGTARLNHVGEYFVGTAVDQVVRHATVPVLVVKQRPHGPYTCMLVATDFSTCSRHALLTAAKLFPGAAIHLVHACQAPGEAWLPSEDLMLETTREAQRQVDAFLQNTVLPENMRRRINSRVVFGECDAVFVNAANEVSADLVVVGTHGRSGFVRAVVGSTAEQLLRCVPADTLMVREPE